MDQKLYKETVVRRGHTYRYYFSPPGPKQPVLLFLHGFPSTSSDWRRQIAFLQPLGYGIIAPDLLGAGGTSKPLDPKEFRLNAMAKDVLDILNGEGTKKVVCVSHDWYVRRRIVSPILELSLVLQGIRARVALVHTTP